MQFKGRRQWKYWPFISAEEKCEEMNYNGNVGKIDIKGSVFHNGTAFTPPPQFLAMSF